MSSVPKKPPASKTGSADVPWLARLTHPLVFFGAALAVYEGTIGTALLTGKHDESTIIWLCGSMAVVILAAMAMVAVLVFKKPHHLMLTQQNTFRDELHKAELVREVATLLVANPKPRTAQHLLDLMDEIHLVLSRDSE